VEFEGFDGRELGRKTLSRRASGTDDKESDSAAAFGAGDGGTETTGAGALDGSVGEGSCRFAAADGVEDSCGAGIGEGFRTATGVLDGTTGEDLAPAGDPPDGARGTGAGDTREGGELTGGDGNAVELPVAADGLDKSVLSDNGDPDEEAAASPAEAPASSVGIWKTASAVSGGTERPARQLRYRP
jgi:hypothetical protein